MAGERILIIDDSEEIISFLVAVLQPLGYMVSYAGDGKDGLARAVYEKPGPGFTGSESARYVGYRRVGGAAPALSPGSGHHDDMRKSRRAADRGDMDKPGKRAAGRAAAKSWSGRKQTGRTVCGVSPRAVSGTGQWSDRRPAPAGCRAGSSPARNPDGSGRRRTAAADSARRPSDRTSARCSPRSSPAAAGAGSGGRACSGRTRSVRITSEPRRCRRAAARSSTSTGRVSGSVTHWATRRPISM